MTAAPRFTDGPRIGGFLEAYCVQTKGRWAGLPLAVEPWQQEILDEAYSLDEHGDRIYHTILLGIPRKNGKSSVGAGLALYHLTLDGENSPEVILASGSREQAGIVFQQAREYVEGSEMLTQHLDAQRFVILPRGGSGFLKRIAADGKLQHGLNPSYIGFDELHSVEAPRQEALWEALVTATLARENPLTFVITTAGTVRSVTLRSLYDQCLNSTSASLEKRDGLIISRDPERGTLMFWYGVPAEIADTLDWDDEASWLEPVLAANPASWIDAKALRKARNDPTIDVQSFKRLHANVWTELREAWLPSGCWAGLARPALAEPETPISIGVDIGLSNDSTGIVYAWPLGDERFALRGKTWATHRDTIAHEHVAGGRFKISTATDYIRSLAERFDIDAVIYDPRFFEGEAERLDEDGFVVQTLEQASKDMAVAYQDFYRGCREGWLEHDGDPILAAHVAACGAELTERGWKIRKLKSSQKIDGAVASVIALYGAMRQEANPHAEGLRTL